MNYGDLITERETECPFCKGKAHLRAFFVPAGSIVYAATFISPPIRFYRDAELQYIACEGECGKISSKVVAIEATV